MNEKMLEQMIKEVLASMGDHSPDSHAERPVLKGTGEALKVKDYPIATNRPELLRTPTGKTIDDITIERIVNGEVNAKDIRIAPETLELQAQVAEDAGRVPLAKNFRRAAELTVVPDDRILEVYNALRPNRSTREELLAIANEFENKYNATINAAFIREAADVYGQRDILKTT